MFDTYARSDQCFCKSLQYSLSVNLLTEHHLGVLSLKGGCTGSSESTFVKMPHCWKSRVTAHMYLAEDKELVVTLYHRLLGYVPRYLTLECFNIEGCVGD